MIESKLLKINNDYYKECDIVMFSADFSKIIKNKHTLLYNSYNYVGNGKEIYKHLYIVSDDKIKKSDLPCLAVDKCRSTLIVCDKSNFDKDYIKEYNKILAATDSTLVYFSDEAMPNNFNVEKQIHQIPEYCIKQFIVRYNKGFIFNRNPLLVKVDVNSQPILNKDNEIYTKMERIDKEYSAEYINDFATKLLEFNTKKAIDENINTWIDNYLKYEW